MAPNNQTPLTSRPHVTHEPLRCAQVVSTGGPAQHLQAGGPAPAALAAREVPRGVGRFWVQKLLLAETNMFNLFCFPIVGVKGNPVTAGNMLVILCRGRMPSNHLTWNPTFGGVLVWTIFLLALSGSVLIFGSCIFSVGFKGNPSLLAI